MKFTSGRILQLGISFFFTAVLIFALFGEQENYKIGEILRSVQIEGVLAYATLSMIGVFVRALRYRLLLRNIVGPEQTPSYQQMFLITAVRNAFVDLIPARVGELSYIYFLKRAGVPVATGLSSFGFGFILDMAVLLMIGVLFFGATPFVFPEGLGGVTIGFGTAVLLVGIMIFGLFLMNFAVWKLPRMLDWGATLMKKVFGNKPDSRFGKLIPAVEEGIEHIAADIDRLSKKGDLSWLIIYTFILRICKYTSLYMLLLAVVYQFGLTYREIHPGLSLLAFVAAEASASLPISGLMGFGAYESSWKLVFSLSHVTIPATLSVSFIVHLITQVKGYTLGLICMFILLIGEFRKSRSKNS